MSQDLKNISDRLDRHPRILFWVEEDLKKPGTTNTGCNGLTVDSIIRAAILKQMMGLTYKELAFFIEDSVSFRAFSRITGKPPCGSTLHASISRIRAATWEKINRAFLREAQHEGVETGRVTRTDATVMDADIHKPSDSSLLYDGVMLMTRFLTRLKEEGVNVVFSDHCRAAKKYVRKIQFMRKSAKQVKIYRKLVSCADKARTYLMLAIETHGAANWVNEAKELTGRVDIVLDQTRRRVFQNETVPASEKLFSLHQPHVDIIKKGSRTIQYGHKLSLTTTKSGVVVDMVIEDGNPADSTIAVRMVERQIEIYGQPPRQTCFDGGYASKANLTEIKDLGVNDVAFHKKKSIKPKDMAKSRWVYRKLVKFRAGVEGNISTLKRRYGWFRCNWKGLAHFKSYAWLSVVAYNLVTFARMTS